MPKKTKAKASDGSPLMVNSVQKAFRVLSAFDNASPRLTLTQLAAKLDIDKSTAQRFAHTLTAVGYLEKDSVTKTLGLTVKTLDLAHVYLRTNPFITRALPYLMHLHQETQETVNLAVLDGSEVVFVMRLVGSHLLSTDLVIGSRLPAYCSAAGLAILSSLSEPAADKILRSSELKPYTPHTIWDLGKIKERLSATRKRGYIVGVAEYFMDDISLGAVVRDHSGAPVGAVTLAVSRSRFTPEEAESRFAKQILAVAQSAVV